jgi:hypothetical protein
MPKGEENTAALLSAKSCGRKAIGRFLSGSNISITLLARVLNPWMAAMACIVKPYLIVFFLLHLWVESRAIVGN